jgi:hypothetical protein
MVNTCSDFILLDAGYRTARLTKLSDRSAQEIETFFKTSVEKFKTSLVEQVLNDVLPGNLSAKNFGNLY